MFVQGFRLATKMIIQPFIWFSQLLSAVNGYGGYMALFAIFTIYRIIIRPAVRGGLGSDRAFNDPNASMRGTSNNSSGQSDDFSVDWSI